MCYTSKWEEKTQESMSGQVHWHGRGTGLFWHPKSLFWDNDRQYLVNSADTPYCPQMQSAFKRFWKMLLPSSLSLVPGANPSTGQWGNADCQVNQVGRVSVCPEALSRGSAGVALNSWNCVKSLDMTDCILKFYFPFLTFNQGRKSFWIRPETVICYKQLLIKSTEQLVSS